MCRGLTLLLLVYVTLDFADPSMPGALNFDLNQSVDATYSAPRTVLPTMKAFPSPALPQAQTVRAVAEKFPRRRPTVHVRVVGFNLKPHAFRVAPVAPPPSDDH
jgi:hypothetical protein